MRTHIDLDENAVAQVMRLGGFGSKKDAVNTALAELARSLKRRELMALRGKVSWQGDLAALRGSRTTFDAPRAAGARARKSTG